MARADGDGVNLLPPEFHFLRPMWFGALLPLAWIVWRLLRVRAVSRGWQAVCDPRLLSHLLLDPGGSRRYRPAAGIVALCGLCAILALAGPVWERLPQPVFRDESALVIALELSTHMEAQDVPPSRLERARFKIADILAQREASETALLVYAGRPFAVTPLTDDVATIQSQLSALTPAIMPEPGRRVALALEEAARLLRAAGRDRGDILLIAAGSGEPEAALRQADELRRAGVRLSVLGVGTGAGAPLPAPDGGYLKDAAGGIVLSSQQQGLLRELAAAGGGLYRQLQPDSADVQELLAGFGEALPQAGEKSSLAADRWREQGPWLLLPALLLAAFGFRRGYLLVPVAVMVLGAPPVVAFSWSDLWWRQDQQAARLFEQGRTGLAARFFEDPRWQAAAWYREGEYERAVEALRGVTDVSSLYLQGNALAQLGRYQEALAAYDQALALNPDDADARHNRELVARLLERQRQAAGEGGDETSGEGADAVGQDEQGQAAAGQGEQSQAAAGQGEQGQAVAGQEGEAIRTAGEAGAQEQALGQASGQEREDEAEDALVLGEESEADGDDREDEATTFAAGRKEGQEEAADEDRLVLQEASEAEEGTATLSRKQREEQIATEAWLRRIPEGSGDYLRRKFQRQYQRQLQQEAGS